MFGYPLVVTLFVIGVNNVVTPIESVRVGLNGSVFNINDRFTAVPKLTLLRQGSNPVTAKLSSCGPDSGGHVE